VSALGPWGGLYDPTYIGTGPGAARRRFEIARIAQELDKERFRHSWRGRLADIGGSGGGFGGFLGRIGTQLGENLSMALPGAIKLGAAGFHTFEGLATGGTHGNIMALPHVVEGMGSAVAQDFHHPWQRPGYLATDLALGVGLLGKLGRTGAAAREHPAPLLSDEHDDHRSDLHAGLQHARPYLRAEVQACHRADADAGAHHRRPAPAPAGRRSWS